MDGKTVLDRAEKLIARGDVDRETLLFFTNNGIRDAFRDTTVFRLQGLKTFTATDGIISCPNLKLAKVVRFDDDGTYYPLKRIPDIKQVYEIYADPTETGTPAHYIITGQSVQIMPAATGTVQIAGEFWPDEMADSTLTNIFTLEIPNFLVFYGVAEYFDFLQEEKRAQYYLGKAMAVLGQWIKENRLQAMHGVHNLPRDPLGNLGYNRRTGAVSKGTADGPESGLIDDCGVYQP